MDFLKEILGEELFKQLMEKVDAYNGNEANKGRQVKLADLSAGGYVAKDDYTRLETELAGKGKELEAANVLIGELKKSSGKDGELQQKITGYETQIALLQQENEALKTDNALKFALAEAGAVDVDYLVFKAKEKGEVRLGGDGRLKNEADIISGLKTQLPSMFSQPGGSQQANGGRKILENPLPGGDGGKAVTKEQFRAMGYNERLQLKKENPERYNNLMKG